MRPTYPLPHSSDAITGARTGRVWREQHSLHNFMHHK